MAFQIDDVLSEVGCERIYEAKLDGFCRGFIEEYTKCYHEIYDDNLVDFLKEYSLKCHEECKSKIMEDFVKAFKDKLSLEELSDFSGLSIDEIKNF